MTPHEAKTAMRALIDSFAPLKGFLKWPNRAFSIPASGIWGNVTFMGGDGFIAGLSDNPLTRHTGILSIQLFDRESNGEAGLSMMADALGNHLSYHQYQGLELLAYSRIEVGSTDNGFFQMNINVPYRVN